MVVDNDRIILLLWVAPNGDYIHKRYNDSSKHQLHDFWEAVITPTHNEDILPSISSYLQLRTSNTSRPKILQKC